MNCQEALNLLYDIIDKEASEIDVRQVEEHLERCRDCFEKYRLETEIQNFLNEKFRKNGSETIQEDLRSRILDRLDEIDKSGAPKSAGTRRPFEFPATVMIAIASAIVVIGAALYGVRYYTHQARFVPLEQSHWAMAGSLQTAETGSTEQLVEAARLSHGYELAPSVGRYQLVDGHSETVMETEMLHYVYAAGASTVSVFLAPASFLDKVADERLEEVVRNEIHFLDHNCRGCRLVFHRMGQTMVITATSDHMIDLFDFVPGRTTI